MTFFWFEMWNGGTLQAAINIGEMGTWVDGVCDLKWMRDLFVWEANLPNDFMVALNSIQITNT
jgi:hypothetical protein